jgi:SAM-dependent methyltransferase
MDAYYDNVNLDLLHAVDPQARAICEFGCGAGALARAVKAGNPTVRYVGVELMAEPLEQAREVLDAGIQRNLDRLPATWAEDAELAGVLPLEGFDYLIFGDVLEHLYDPEAVLKEAVLRLAPGGTLLACIPNVQHWSVFAQLTMGSWPRADMGLFDRTHIRWFTLNDMLLLMQGCGLVVEKVIPRVFEQEKGIEIMEYLEPLASYLGADPEALVQRGLPLQYVLVCRKPA